VAGALCGALSTLALAPSQPAFPPWGVTLDYMDRHVPPGTDFFRYANGSWLRSAVIPADRRLAGVNLEIDQGNEAKLKAIIASLAQAPDVALSDEERKLRDLYNAFEDTQAIEAADLAPARADLERIASLKTLAEVAAFMAAPDQEVDGPFRARFTVDKKNPSAYILLVTQSGLGMPDRDYYLSTDKGVEATRDAYKKYLADMLAFVGITDPARASGVYALEKQLAEAHWPAAERREAERTYNPMTLRSLEEFAPQFPWREYFAAEGVAAGSAAGERQFDAAEKSAFPKLAATFGATPVAVWRDYLTVHYLHSHADYLPRRIDDTNFAFYGTIISGQKQQLPRDIRGIHLLDEAMGEALGKLYCARYFSPAAKSKSQELVGNLLRAYAHDIDSLGWMTPETRAKALEKLRAFTLKIGYPDRWRDYSTLRISREDLVADIRNVDLFDWNRRLARLDQPVDRTEWYMTPQTNNAYYSPTLNEIVFPAGILQPPYFDPNADAAVNYGEIGAVIGHEISHAFDDQGSKYDASGRLSNWWTEEDRRNFDARTAQLARQYDRYEPLPGLHLNGKLTLGENIADLAGLVIAHKAYEISLGGKPAPILSGLSGEQRFYVAYGQSWRELWSDGLTRRVVLSNPHSPPKYRVDGVVRNDEGWYGAFPQVKAGDALYLPPRERVALW